MAINQGDSATRAIKVPTAASQLGDALRDMILRRELAPGTPIEEAPTAERFGVSRNTVREAIRDLARAGLVKQRRLRPAVVVTLTEADVRDIAFVRGTIEISAARAVIEQKADITVVEGALEELLALKHVPDWTLKTKADLGFHAAIVAATGSRRLLKSFDALESELRLTLGLTDRWDSDPEDQARKHQAIFDALAKRDLAESIELLSHHINDAKERVLRIMASKRFDEESVL
jgi:DNA-binding GntR family transcriptional regulator